MAALKQKAFYVSADPDDETRQREELEYNLQNDNNLRPLITRSEPEYNKKSNRSTVKAGRHKISLPNFIFTVVYVDYHTNKKKRRKQLPVREYSSDALQILAKNKRISWHPGCFNASGVSFGQVYNYLCVQANPFIVLDFDDVLPEVVEQLVREKWQLKLPFSVSSSVSGTGTHLHVWIDMSMAPAVHTAKAKKDQPATHYQSTYRFELWSALKLHFAKLIEKDTGLKVDMNAASRETMAITQHEIGVINTFWKNREPVLISEGLCMEALRLWKTKHELRNERYLTGFIKEFDRFLNDPNALECVFKYLRDTDVKIGPTKYYEKVLKCFKDHQKEIVSFWTKNMKKLAWLRCKTEGISIEQATVAAKLFGLASPKHATYMRHFALYIFSLVKTGDRIIHKITDRFSFIDQPKAHFDSDFLAKNWYTTRVDQETLSVENIKNRMGNGHTWETIQSATPYVRWIFGSVKGQAIMLEALDLSNAKKKPQRRAEIKRFFRLLDHEHGKVPDRQTG